MCLAAIDAGGLAEAGKAAGCVEGRRWCLSLAALALGAGPAPNPSGAGLGWQGAWGWGLGRAGLELAGSRLTGSGSENMELDGT